MVRLAINVVENNPYLPQPFVMTEAAICLRDAIRAAGYPCEHRVNTIDPAAYSIVLNAFPDLEGRLEHLDRKRCAIFNFEQLGSSSSLAGPAYRQWLADWLVLDYHASNVALLREENGAAQQVLELPIVPSPSLAGGPLQDKTVDVLFYGTMSDRRRAVLNALQERGLSVEVVAGAYGQELAPAVRRARLVLHIHYYSNSLFPIARVLQPVMQGVPVVCETSNFSALNDWSASGIRFADHDGLVQACVDLLSDPAGMEQRAQQARAFAGTLDFATPFAQVVRAFESRSGGGSAPAPALAEAPAPQAVTRPAQAATITAGQPQPERALTDEEIEAILAQEAEHPPEPDQPAPQFTLVQRQPGQGPIGRWVAWLLVAFMLLGSINLIMSYR